MRRRNYGPTDTQAKLIIGIGLLSFVAWVVLLILWACGAFQ